MSKPDWCPQRVWDEAWGVEAWARALYADNLTDSEKEEVVEAIAAAILAAEQREREACVQICRTLGVLGGVTPNPYADWKTHADNLATALSNRGEHHD